jgi:hypothetical protein
MARTDVDATASTDISYVIQPPPQSGFPTLNARQKKFNSRPVTPTFL